MRDRDALVPKHATPPKGIDTGHVPEPVFEDLTGQYSTDPDLLKQHRRRRTTDERLEHLEDKNDKLMHAILAANRHQVDARTKIITHLISAIAGLVSGYLLGGCV